MKICDPGGCTTVNAWMAFDLQARLVDDLPIILPAAMMATGPVLMAWLLIRLVSRGARG